MEETKKQVLEESKRKLKGAKEQLVKGVNPKFWKSVALAMHPSTYSELSSRKIRKGLIYLASLLFASFIIMSIISIPNIISLPGYIENELSRFTILNVSIDAEMSSPVMLTRDDPQIIIDTTGRRAELGEEKILITEDSLFYRPYAFAREYNLSEFQDITKKKGEVSKALALAAILLIPTIILTSYAMFFIKYLITIIAAALLIFLIARLFKKDLGIKRSINTAIYAITPMVLLEVIFIPFNSKYLVPLFQAMGMNFYLVTLLVYASLAAFSSYFASKHKKGEKIEWGF